MQRALALAARGLASTDPNPRVGCVIARGERIVGEGWHERAGEAHAEVAALRAAGPQASGATVYVTLEPCSHHGRTPPCTLALTGARVARVVYAIGDPNPQVNGQGAAALTAAGITVQSGLLESEAHELNAGFFKRMQHGRPFVRVKLAMSLDGRTALADGTSQWITGEAARADVQAWRARSSAVLTGVGTVLSDDPRLSVRPRRGCRGAPAAARGARYAPAHPRGRAPLHRRWRGADPHRACGPRRGARRSTDARAWRASRRCPRRGSTWTSGRCSIGSGSWRPTRCWWRRARRSPGRSCARGWRTNSFSMWRRSCSGPRARALVELPPLATLTDAPGFALPRRRSASAMTCGCACGRVAP